MLRVQNSFSTTGQIKSEQLLANTWAHRSKAHRRKFRTQAPPAAAEPTCVDNSQTLVTHLGTQEPFCHSLSVCACPWYTQAQKNMESTVYLYLVYPVLSALLTLIFLQKLRCGPHAEHYQAWAKVWQDDFKSNETNATWTNFYLLLLGYRNKTVLFSVDNLCSI